MRAMCVVGLLFLLSACASTSTRSAEHLAIGEADALYLGGEVATFVGRTLPPASATVEIKGADGSDNGEGSALDDAVDAALRGRGFAVAAAPAAEPTGSADHVVIFDAVSLDVDGVLLQLVIDGKLLSRLYSRDAAGNLSPASAYTMRAPE